LSREKWYRFTVYGCRLTVVYIMLIFSRSRIQRENKKTANSLNRGKQ